VPFAWIGCHNARHVRPTTTRPALCLLAVIGGLLAAAPGSAATPAQEVPVLITIASRTTENLWALPPDVFEQQNARLKEQGYVADSAVRPGCGHPPGRAAAARAVILSSTTATSRPDRGGAHSA